MDMYVDGQLAYAGALAVLGSPSKSELPTKISLNTWPWPTQLPA